MRKDLMNILACPVCKSSLELKIDKEDRDEERDDVISGTLLCVGCNESYTISDSIPNLLPPRLRE